MLFSVDFFSSPFASPPSLSLSVCALSLRPWLSLPDLFAKVPLYPAALHALGVLYKSAYIFLFLFFLKCWLHYQYTHTHTRKKNRNRSLFLTLFSFVCLMLSSFFSLHTGTRLHYICTLYTVISFSVFFLLPQRVFTERLFLFFFSVADSACASSTVCTYSFSALFFLPPSCVFRCTRNQCCSVISAHSHTFHASLALHYFIVLLVFVCLRIDVFICYPLPPPPLRGTLWQVALFDGLARTYFAHPR